MILRFQVPIDFFLTGPTRDSLKLLTNFAHKGLVCSVQIEASDPMESTDLPEANRHFGRCTQLEISVSDEPPNHFFLRVIEARDFEKIREIVVSVANRCIRAIRNFGLAPHLHELSWDDSQSPEIYLKRLSAAIRDHQSGEEWTDLIKTPKGKGLLYWALVYSKDDTASNLTVDRWPDIQEAIQDDLPPLPEDEFRTNALEHLKLKNLRMALVESIIGLEIVLTRYLKEYL